MNKGLKKIIDKVMNDQNEIEIQGAIRLWLAITATFIEESPSVKPLVQKLTQKELLKFMEDLTNSYIAGLYVTSSNSKKQFEERIKEVNKSNVGFSISAEKEVSTEDVENDENNIGLSA